MVTVKNNRIFKIVLRTKPAQIVDGRYTNESKTKRDKNIYWSLIASLAFDITNNTNHELNNKQKQDDYE